MATRSHCPHQHCGSSWTRSPIFILLAFLCISMCLCQCPVSAQVRDHFSHYDPALYSYEDYVADRSASPLTISSAGGTLAGYMAAASGGGPKVLVIVNDVLYPLVETRLNTYILDVQNAGYLTEVHRVAGGTPEGLKAFIKSKYELGDLVGCVFVGDIPIPWYETYFESYETGTASFPCDLFYCDLDGEWRDDQVSGTMKPGVYDGHRDGTGDKAPEIFVGRIDASRIAGYDQVNLTNAYFDKLHTYYTGTMPRSNYGLTYTDSAFEPEFEFDNCMSKGYPSYEVVSGEATSGADYRDYRLTSDRYEFVQLLCHSLANLHGFDNPPWLLDDHIRAVPPHANFYWLFACLAGRYTSDHCIAQAYIHSSSPTSLAVIASSKVMFSSDLSYFYDVIAGGGSLGEALRMHFSSPTITAGLNEDANYGLTLFGDPLLAPVTITYVKPSGDDSNDGRSWATAKRTINGALQDPNVGDDVWVAAGTYSERVNMKNGIAVYGGFTGTETSRNGRDWKTNVTVIDGYGGHAVSFSNISNPATRIDGFTIRGGGAGVYSRSSSGTIANNTITGNNNSEGGGISCTYGNQVKILNNTITNNYSYNGGGIRFYISSGEIAGNTITGNSSPYYAGGVCWLFSTGAITNNIIAGNSGSIGGGTVCQGASGSLLIANNTICDNAGDGLILYDSAATIKNNIVAFNSSGIYRSQSGYTPTLTNNAVYGNTSYNYSGLSAGVGDISLDPTFVSRTPRNYHLYKTSPCINAGDSTVVGTYWVDMDGNPRVGKPQVDIGVDEFYQVVAPRVSPAGGRYLTPVMATVTGYGAEVHYTTDGSSPTEASPLYTQPLIMSSTTTLKVAAFRPTWTPSEVVTAVYDFSGPTTLRVKSNAPGPAHDGRTWATAYLKVSDAIANSITGDEIWVAAGTYTENIRFKCGVALYGGFAGTEASRNQRDWRKNVTILDGGQKDCTVTIPGYRYSGGRLDGFTIRNGKATTCGGGVSCMDSTMAIENNVISGNTAGSYGGGIYISGSTATVANNVVCDNHAVYGAGVYVSGYSYPATMANNAIVGNIAANGGGGLYIYNASPAVTNNIVAFNGMYGIEAYLEFPCGGPEPSSPMLSHNDFYGNTGVDYMGISSGPGDISQDPQFVDRTSGNLRILGTSPCVDAGTNVGVPSSDADGRPRPYDGNADYTAAWDIGAYEYQPTDLAYARNTFANGTKVSLGPLVVSAMLPPDGSCGDTWMYVQRTDNAAGIRVYTSQWFDVGQLVHVFGTMQTDADTGERYILAASGWPKSTGRSTVAMPLNLRNEWVGGVASGLTPVLREAFGFYNVGLLVTTWGRVTATDPGGLFFHIDDGSSLQDGSGHTGVRVMQPWTALIPAVGSYVRVTGVSGSVKVGSSYARVIRPRGYEDIETITNWETAGIALTPGGWNFVALPGVPANPLPEAVFVGCAGGPGIALDGNLSRFDPRRQQWITFYSCPVGWEFENCLMADGFGLYVPSGGSQCYTYQRSALDGEALISLPKGSETLGYFSLIGNPFDQPVGWRFCKVTDGTEVLSLIDAISQGWISKVERWNGTAWVQVTDLYNDQMLARTAYKIYPRRGSLGFICYPDPRG